MARGVFITLEGGEGAGKSTQAARLTARIGESGREVVRTREPGGSVGAEAIRELLVNGAPDRWSPTTETLLMYAARRDHMERLITPALDRGAVVVCDRFADSTRAYQGAAGGVSQKFIADLEEGVLAGVRPDVTLILDLPVELGLARTHRRESGEGRFESKGVGFHKRLGAYFRKLAADEPDRCVLIDGARDEEHVAEAIWRAVSPRLAA